MSSYLDCDLTCDESRELEDENGRLRELVRDMQKAICRLILIPDYADTHEEELGELDDRMRELGIELEAE